MPKRSPIDSAVSGLTDMADAALLKRLKKAKGLLEQVIAEEEGEAPSGENDMPEADLSELESSLGE